MTTFTREDYEMAAKAAGIELEWFPARVWNGFIDGYEDATDGSGTFVAGNVEWNPPEDDGDALRLAVALRLQVTPGTYNSEEVIAYRSGHAESHERVHFQQDIGAATRRAIFRAAIAIGRAMP